MEVADPKGCSLCLRSRRHLRSLPPPSGTRLLSEDRMVRCRTRSIGNIPICAIRFGWIKAQPSRTITLEIACPHIVSLAFRLRVSVATAAFQPGATTYQRYPGNSLACPNFPTPALAFIPLSFLNYKGIRRAHPALR
jgi:hypothetical protein